MVEPATFWVYRIPESPRDFGYYITEGTELRQKPPNKDEADRRLPLVWSGIAADLDHALTLAKKAEETCPANGIKAPTARHSISTEAVHAAS